MLKLIWWKEKLPTNKLKGVSSWAIASYTTSLHPIPVKKMKITLMYYFLYCGFSYPKWAFDFFFSDFYVQNTESSSRFTFSKCIIFNSEFHNQNIGYFWNLKNMLGAGGCRKNFPSSCILTIFFPASLHFFKYQN